MTMAIEAAPWAVHVRWAIERQTLYLLDLRADTYLALPVAQWQAQHERLSARGFFAARQQPPTAIELQPKARAGALAFWRACLWARAILKRRRLEAAAQLLSQRDEAADGARLDGAIARFQSLRPLYPRAASCLFDSLALGRFLLSGGITCELVFGVRGQPFAAHAWLQRDGRIVNDDPAYCAGFVTMRAS